MSSCRVWIKGRDDAKAQFGAGTDFFFLDIFDAFGDAHDIAHRNAAAFARQAIAAARTAHALEDAGANQLLHDLLEITLRHALAGGDFLGLHGFGPGIEGDVDHRFQRQQGLSGQAQHHDVFTVMPVEPKPPAPRALSERFSLSTIWACSWRAITICAILAPRAILNGVSP